MNMPLPFKVDHSETIDPKAGRETEMATPSNTLIMNRKKNPISAAVGVNRVDTAESNPYAAKIFLVPNLEVRKVIGKVPRKFPMAMAEKSHPLSPAV